MSQWMIQAEGLSKKFSKTLGQAMRYGLRDSFRHLLGLRNADAGLRAGEFWAVDGVTFEVEAGQCLGIMGVNGSGKSTLLRLLNGIFLPDRGLVRLRGQVGALIAAGAGFSPMLSGRENIFVSGALMGMSRARLKRHFDDIIDFAGIGEFIDAPVRHYSSGMQVRLGFAVAAFSQPDVLLVDEVLAVGDMNFQKKCYEHLHRLKRQGTCILLVSHSIGAIWAMCDVGVFLDRGQAKVVGPIDDVIKAYKDKIAPDPNAGGVAGNDDSRVGGTGDAAIYRTRLLSGRDGHAKDVFEFGEPLVLESHVDVRETIAGPIFRYTLDAVHYKYIACLDSLEQHMRLESIQPGKYVVRTIIPQQNLMPGSYSINVCVCREGLGLHLFFHNGVAQFKIKEPCDRLLFGEDNAVLYLDSCFSVAPVQEQQFAA